MAEFCLNSPLYVLSFYKKILLQLTTNLLEIILAYLIYNLNYKLRMYLVKYAQTRIIHY